MDKEVMVVLGKEGAHTCGFAYARLDKRMQQFCRSLQLYVWLRVEK